MSDTLVSGEVKYSVPRWFYQVLMPTWPGNDGVNYLMNERVCE